MKRAFELGFRLGKHSKDIKEFEIYEKDRRIGKILWKYGDFCITFPLASGEPRKTAGVWESHLMKKEICIGNDLPVIIATRLPNKKRPDYEELMAQIGLLKTANEMEITCATRLKSVNDCLEVREVK